MKLMTAQHIKKAKRFALYSQEEKGMNATCWLKFFCPCNSYTWFVTEAEQKEDGDWLFFGLVINNHNEKEFGYFTLSQLAEIRLPFGLRIERDMYFDDAPLCKIA